MKGFRDRLRAAIEHSAYKEDIWGLSTDAGLGRKTIYNTINDKKLDDSQTGPGLFGMARIASLLGTSLDHLAGIAPPVSRHAEDPTSNYAPIIDHARGTLAGQHTQAGSPPSADGLLRIHAKSGGMLAAFNEHLDYCDQYAPCTPKTLGLKALAVGKKSLSAITMGLPSLELLQTALDTVPDQELKSQWVAAYAATIEHGPKATIETLNVQMPNHPVRVKMEFIRTLLPVRDDQGLTRILNFSLLII